MREVTCSSCGGSGKSRHGEITDAIDWSFDFSTGFAGYCASQERKDEMRDRCVAFLKTLKRGHRFITSGQFERTAVDVGMYDGWPYWKPTPAVSYVGPLGSIEYAFYNDVSAPWSYPAETADAVAKGRDVL